MKRVILGGGVSGLSAAWYLYKQDPSASIALIEKQPRLGGWVESTSDASFFFERGPRSLARGRSPVLLELIEELGLSQELLTSPAGARYLWHQGRLQRLGSFWPTLAYAAIRELFQPRISLSDESIHDFAARRFGERAARLFFDPMTLGVYAGDPRKLSIRSCFGALAEAERTDGSVVRWLCKKKKAASGLFTLRGGLERLVHELRRQLPVDWKTNCMVDAITPTGVATSAGFIEADEIISALPAYEVSRLTGVDLYLPYRSIWVVHLGFAPAISLKKGFGYLVPSTEGESLLGMVWDSEVFPPHSPTRITAMVRAESASDGSAATEIALEALERHLQITCAPSFLSCRLAERAIPQFEVGHSERLGAFEKEMKRRFPTLRLTGNYFAGASLEAAVARSRQISGWCGLVRVSP